MKKVILASLLLALALLLVFVFSKVVIDQSKFGPASLLIVLAILLFALFAFACLRAYETSKKEAILRVWLTLASTLFVYVSVDLLAGFLIISNLGAPVIRDRILHHKLAVNTNSEYRGRDYHYIQRVNSYGLRGPEIQLEKDADTYRILMLGDSFTMGKGVSDDQTFSALLEVSLNESTAAKAGKNFQVLNAGVDSYSPILSFLQLRRMANILNPDLVVLNLDMSDLVNESIWRELAAYRGNGELVGVSGVGINRGSGQRGLKTDTVANSIRNWIDRHLYFSRLILFYVDKWTQDAPELSVRNTVTLASFELLKHTLAGDTVDRTEQWDDIFDSIQRIKNHCDDHEIQFFLTTYPWGHQVSDTEWLPGRRILIPDDAVVSDASLHTIQKLADENSIDFLDTFPAFRAYRGSRPLYFKYDMHWTQQGQALMAKELERFMLEQILVTN